MGTREIWTLTVDPRDSSGITTTVHNSEAEAKACLFVNYDPHGTYKGDVQACIDGECLVVHIQCHQLGNKANPERAAKAERALREYNDDPAGNVGDLLTDLLHYCDQMAVDFHICLDRADLNHIEEVKQ